MINIRLSLFLLALAAVAAPAHAERSRDMTGGDQSEQVESRERTRGTGILDRIFGSKRSEEERSAEQKREEARKAEEEARREAAAAKKRAEEKAAEEAAEANGREEAKKESIFGRIFGGGNDDDDDEDEDEGRGKDKDKRGFSEKEEEILENWKRGNASWKKSDRPLPPGLQKKVDRGGSLPPGWQKKLQVGSRLEPEMDAQAVSLPEEILKKLPKQPEDTELVRLEEEIVRVTKGTREVLDILGGGRGQR